MAYSMTYNSVSLGQYGLVVRSASWQLLPAPKMTSKTLAQADGQASFSASFGPREFDVDYAISIALQTLSPAKTIDELCALVATALQQTIAGEKTLVFDKWSGKSWNVRLTSAFSPAIKSARFAEGALTFIADNPWSIATSATTHNSNVITGDTTLSITATGNTVQAPTWIVKNGATPAASVALQNVTTGELVTCSAGLGANEWLRLKRTDTMDIEVSSDSGSTWVSAFGGVTGIAPSMAGGAANSVKVYGITSGTLDISYYARSI